MRRAAIYAGLLVTLAVSGCSSRRVIGDCMRDTDISPEGYRLVLHTVPNARVEYTLNGTQNSLYTVSGVETLDTGGKPVNEVNVTGCRQYGPRS